MESETRAAAWEARLGHPLSPELSKELEAGEASADDPPIYVYSDKGEAEEVRPATGVTVTADEVVVMFGEAPVASYPRDGVMFASKTPVSPDPAL